MENSDKNLYELGYLLIPVVPMDKLPEEVNVLREVIESAGGLILNMEQPKMKKLAYEIAHNLAGGKKTRYEDAYFGWVNFQLTPEALAEVVSKVKNNVSILRHLVINLSSENNNLSKPEIKGKNGIKKGKRLMSDKDIDKEIDNLLTKNNTVEEVVL